MVFGTVGMVTFVKDLLKTSTISCKSSSGFTFARGRFLKMVLVISSSSWRNSYFPARRKGFERKETWLCKVHTFWHCSWEPAPYYAIWFLAMVYCKASKRQFVFNGELIIAAAAAAWKWKCCECVPIMQCAVVVDFFVLCLQERWLPFSLSWLRFPFAWFEESFGLMCLPWDSQSHHSCNHSSKISRTLYQL